jgi:hypothetical protein
MKAPLPHMRPRVTHPAGSDPFLAMPSKFGQFRQNPVKIQQKEARKIVQGKNRATNSGGTTGRVDADGLKRETVASP